MNSLLSLDLSLFRLLNTHTASFLDTAMLLVTSLGKMFWLWIGIAALTMARSGRNERWMTAAVLLAVILADAMTTHLLKPLVGRPRPFFTLPDVRLIFPTDRLSLFGFPSNHAANVAAAATVLSLFSRRWWVWLTTGGIAIFVGYSRIYCGVHYPLDVLGGYAVGATIGVTAWYFCRMMIQRKAVEK